MERNKVEFHLKLSDADGRSVIGISHNDGIDPKTLLIQIDGHGPALIMDAFRLKNTLVHACELLEPQDKCQYVKQVSDGDQGSSQYQHKGYQGSKPWKNNWHGDNRNRKWDDRRNDNDSRQESTASVDSRAVEPLA